MSKENYKNYFNGGCLTCMFAERDERGRYLGHCSGFSNCFYKEYKGETDITEEEKDEKIAQLQFQLALTEKALELACEEQDLYWFNKWAGEQGITLIEYLKNEAKEEMKSE